METDLSRTRIELKYVIPPEMADEVALRIPAEEAQEYRVTTLYFDSPDQALTRMALEDPYQCVKVRSREYLDGSPDVWFEIKSRSGAWTQKWRFRMPKAELGSLLTDGVNLDIDALSHAPAARADGRAEAIQCLQSVARGTLVPCGAVYAHRRTFTVEQIPLRFTLDENIAYYAAPEGLYSLHESLDPDVLGTPILREPNAVLELKHAGDVPLWCTRIVSALTVSAYSKFRTLVLGARASGRVVGHVDRL
jgi:VTC domain-containing protein